MEIKKSHWVADENRVSLAMPINKVNKENRLVSGFATLDNIDTSDDIVTAEASKDAFARFRGNIREMHEPIAAGRLVDFKEEEFFYNGEFYRGIYATAYVSKGAQDTWEKVLDGTLSGFSIGGNITDQETKFVKDAGDNGKTIRFIKSYDLIELSLVDNPANQLANVFSIVKSVTGNTMMKGMAVETHLVNVFWCPEDEIAKTSTNEVEKCINCSNSMEVIDWFEKGEDDVAKTATAVAKFLRQKEDSNAVTKQADSTAHGEGGVEMADKIEKNDEVITTGDVDPQGDETTSEEVVAPEVEEEAPAEVEVDDAKTEEAGEVVEEAPVEPDFEKMFDELKMSVTDSIQKTVESVEQRVEDVTKTFNEKASEFEKSLGELSEKLEGIRTEREDVAKRLDALEKSSAVKKSGEVEGPEPVKKSQTGLWSGTFFDAD